jgi:hypothetical protein
MKINLLCLCVLLVGLSGCAKNGMPFSSASDTSSSSVAETSETTATTKTAAVAKKHNGSGTLVVNPIVFNKEAYIRDAVKNECNLDGKLAQFIEQNATDQYAEILTNSTSKSSKSQILTITIEQVDGGRGRGGWGRSGLWGGRGGNMVGVQGTLTQGGKVLGSFKAMRVTSGGAFGGFKGACAKLGRCVRTLGSDIAGWLTDPTMNATLGDF